MDELKYYFTKPFKRWLPKVIGRNFYFRDFYAKIGNLIKFDILKAPDNLESKITYGNKILSLSTRNKIYFSTLIRTNIFKNEFHNFRI